MRKKLLLFTIVLSASTLCAVAQSSNIDVDKLMALADATPKEIAPVKISDAEARFFRKHISLINKDVFELRLIANTSEKKVVAKKQKFKKIKIDENDAAYFRQHIRLFAGDSFQLAFVPNFGEYGPNEAFISVPVIDAPPFNPKASSPAQIALNKSFATGIFNNPVVDPEANSWIKSTTNKELQDYLYSKIVPNMVDLDAQFAEVLRDTLRARIPQKMPANITTLKQQVQLVYNDTLRAALYQEIADHYLAYDSISIRATRNYYMEQALEFTMKALHTYSKMGDQNGLRLSYSNLSKVYKAQKKLPEAKWFILQANTIARQQKDVPRIINTLVDLAGIKMYIKDYKLAQSDLDEALLLSSQNHYSKQESMVQANFAILYGNMNDTTKSVKALKRHDAIEDSIRKAEEARRLAELKKRDSAELAKKKLLTSAEKKPTKSNSTKKAASL